MVASTPDGAAADVAAGAADESLAPAPQQMPTKWSLAARTTSAAAIRTFRKFEVFMVWLFFGVIG